MYYDDNNDCIVQHDINSRRNSNSSSKKKNWNKNKLEFPLETHPFHLCNTCFLTNEQTILEIPREYVSRHNK